MNILSPSILAADFYRLGEEIQAVERAGAQYLHIDVMDGVFVPSISFGMPVIKSIRERTKLVFDVHLMIIKPERYIEYFAECGADIITVHVETLRDVRETCDLIHNLGMKVGLSLNPETPIETVFPFLSFADMVLVMTVHPGFGGQKFIEDSIEKITGLKKEIENQKVMVNIEVDGGIVEDNLEEVLQAGANVIVTGSAVFGADTEENARKLLTIMQK